MISQTPNTEFQGHTGKEGSRYGLINFWDASTNLCIRMLIYLIEIIADSLAHIDFIVFVFTESLKVIKLILKKIYRDR